MNSPVMVGCNLSPTFIPALQKAVATLRRRYPKECDGDLIGRVLFIGICKIVDQQFYGDTCLRITGCRDPQLWYADKVGQQVPFIGMWPEAYISRDTGGYINRVEFDDAEIVEAPTC